MPRSVWTLTLLALLLSTGSGPPRLLAAEDEAGALLHPRAALRVENLLADAGVALAAMRLTTPEHDNAYDRYQQVLDFLPEDPRALAGINRIADAYFGLALEAAERGDHSEAERLFNLAVGVAPHHASQATVARSIERLLAAPVEQLEIDGDALRSLDPALARRLESIGSRAKREHLLVVIRVPRDDLGRWVYQRMNAGPPDVRLRARSEIGSPASIALRREN